MITCRKMTEASAADALALLKSFLAEDEHYLDSSSAYGDRGGGAVEDALGLFLARPEIGFVWLSYDGETPVGVCVVCFAISTSLGAVVAKLDDYYVASGRQGRGIGSAQLEQLKEELRRLGVRRIDTSVHLRNDEARRFYETRGFRPLGEERIACLL